MSSHEWKKICIHRMPYEAQNYFPVIDAAGRLAGIFSIDDVRAYLYDETLWQLLAVARDIMTANFVSLIPNDDLNKALRRFTSIHIDELAVTAANDSSQLVDMLRRLDVIVRYHRELDERQEAKRESA